MRRLTRRGFLAGTVAAGSSLLLSPRSTGQADDRPVQMSIARWKAPGAPSSDEELSKIAAKLTEQAMASLGGMRRFVKNGDVVWIKPNIGFVRPANFAANTNPDVVAALVRLCFDAGAKTVRVGDNSCFGAEGAYPTSGIEAAVKAVGGEVVYLKPERFKMMKIGGDRLTEWLVSSEIIESDLVINVPVVKTHGMTAISVCFKNYMGVAGGPRQEWHTDMPRCLTDFAAFMKPRLSVLDAVHTLVRNGPTGLRPSDAPFKGIVAAGTDVVGLESFGAELLGVDPRKGKTIAKGVEKGLGTIDYRQLVLREQDIA